MTKKPSLFSRAAGEALDSTAQPPTVGDPFEDRISVLHETAERVPARLRRVDPDQCRMWKYHNRSYEVLSEENCRDLIDSIIAQGRQEQPAIVREIKGQGPHRYEVIAGGRRHFAISWLRANNYPQMDYFVEVRDLEDEECFRLADVENRNRKDISDHERATDYQGALNRYYTTQLEMAKRLNVAENWLSRYLLLANLPKEIVSAYADVHDLKLRHARELSPLLKSAAGRKRIVTSAKALAQQHQADRAAGATPMAGPQVFQALLNAAKTQPTRQTAKGPLAQYPSRSGKPMLIVNASTKNSLSFVVDRRSGADPKEIAKAFGEALKDHL